MKRLAFATIAATACALTLPTRPIKAVQAARPRPRDHLPPSPPP